MKHQRVVNSKPKELFLQTGWESRPAHGVPELGPREVSVDLTTFGQTVTVCTCWYLTSHLIFLYIYLVDTTSALLSSCNNINILPFT